MLPVIVLQGAAGPSQWVPISFEQSSYTVGYLVTVQGGSTLTFKMQFGFYDPSRNQEDVKSITRTTTVATLTWFDPHPTGVGDSLVISGGGAPLDGTYDVASVTSSTVVTYTVANSGVTAAPAGRRCQLIRTVDDLTVTGKTATIAGAVPFVCDALRVNVTAYTSGGVALTVNQGQ